MRLNWILAIVIVTIFLAVNVSADRIGYWKFDEGLGNNSLESGGPAANITNITAWTTGKSGTAININNSAGESMANGNYSYLTNTSIIGTIVNYSYTLEFWFQPYNVTGKYNIMEHQPTAGDNRGFEVFMDRAGSTGGAGSMFFYTANLTAGWKKTWTTTIFTAFTWYHIGLVVNGTGKTIFVNGAYDTSGVDGHTEGRLLTTPMYIGAHMNYNPDYATAGFSTDYFGKFAMDELMIWNESRTQAQISTDMNEYVLPETGGSSGPINRIGFNSSLDYGLLYYYNFTSTAESTRFNKFPAFNLTVGAGIPSLTSAGFFLGGYSANVSVGNTFNISSNKAFSFKQANQQTLNFWVKMRSQACGGLNQVILSKYDGGGVGYFIDTCGDGADTSLLGFNYVCEADASLTQAGSLFVNNWTMVTMVKNATGVQMWVNGTYKTSCARVAAFDTTSAKLELGSQGTTGLPANSQIDEMGWWARALTSTEIGQLYNSSSGLGYGTPPATPRANLSTYETAYEDFALEVNTSSAPTSASLVYNNTNYVASVVTNGATNYTLLAHVSVPIVTTQEVHPYYFVWNVSSVQNRTLNFTQIVDLTTLVLCNSTYNIYYLNYTFKDEGTLAAMNGSISSLTLNYSLSSLSSVTKTYTFQNLTDDNRNFAFCYSPPDRGIYVTQDVKYKLTGYPQRIYAASGTLTNSTTNQVLYLLGSGDGVSSSYQILTQAGSPVASALVRIEKQFSGTWTLIAQDLSDSSGLTTFWLDPTTDHRITVTKTGYASTTVIIRPTQTLYSIRIGAGGNYSYAGALSGIKWSIYPGNEILTKDREYTFGFNVTAMYGDLVSCSMEIYNSSNSPNISLLASVSGCNAYGGNISITLNVGNLTKITRLFYLDTGSGSVVIDPMHNWCENVSVSSFDSIVSFFSLLSTMDDELGGTDARASFTRIVSFFLIITLILGVMNVSFGWDLQNPGMAIGLIAFLVIFASAGGWFRVDFYGFKNMSIGLKSWLDFGFIPLLVTLFTAAFYIHRWRRDM
jgi:hypothetical protein